MSDQNQWDENEPPPPTPWYKRRNVLIAGVAAVAILAFAFTRGMGERAAATNGAKPSPIGVVVPYEPPPSPRAAAPPPPPPPPPPPTIKLTHWQMPFPPPTVRPAPPHAAERPIMMSYAVKQDRPKQTTGASHADPQTKLAFAASTIPGSKASPAYDETYMLDPGLLICVLDVAIDSSLPGPLMCHLHEPVFSRAGVVLMPPGTQIMGKYQTMQNNGADRLMAVSTFAHTPDGVWVPLTGEPWADGLGRSGLAGNIDRHYMQRFGGAVLLDLASSGLNIIQSSMASRGSAFISTSGSGNLASQILQATINMPPTFSRPQGGLIAIWITHPISFADSYRIRTVAQP